MKTIELENFDIETLISDLGFNWEDVYDDYEEFIEAINEWVELNKT